MDAVVFNVLIPWQTRRQDALCTSTAHGGIAALSFAAESSGVTVGAAVGAAVGVTVDIDQLASSVSECPGSATGQ